MYQAVRLCCLSALLLSACADERVDVQPSDEGTPAHVASSGLDSLTRGSLGQVEYRFDPQRLTRAEIDIALPPDSEDTVFAVKFIPVELSGNLGTQGCSYGISADNEECTADEEVGIALALLERPIDHYRLELEEEADNGSLDTQVMLAGHRGFAFSSEDPKTEVRYTFLPLHGRTLLLMERSEDGVDEGAAALAQLRHSIDY